MIMIILFLIIGFVLLIKGADFLVDGAVAIAEKLKISAILIGLTIVAFGTSTPELAVNIVSALKPETSDIGLGNILGSNIFNIGLILGLSALIYPLAVKRVIITREIPFMFLSAVAFVIMVWDQGGLSLGDGLILLLFFAIFLYYLSSTILLERNNSLKPEFAKEYQTGKPPSLNKGVLFLLLGLGGVILGGQLVVENAASLARLAGISEILIGLTVVAIGTSLPELATSAVAAFKKEPDIAVGNIVGSNIFNTFFILGVNALISPVPFGSNLFIDAWVMVLFSVLLFVVSLTGKTIRRSEGLFLLTAYLFYLAFTILRG